MTKSILTLLISLFTISASSQIKMPHVFADNMILQQESEVALWGKAKPSSSVEVVTEWNSEKYVTTVTKDSTWHLKVRTGKASYQSYEIIIRNGQHIKKLNNILLGEVWFCGGQSNMEHPMKGYFNQPILGSSSDIASSKNNYLRCFNVKKHKSPTLLDDQYGEWLIASPGTTGEFTATGFYFGRFLQQLLDVPVALLHCSYGGSAIQTWMSDDALEEAFGINTQESYTKTNVLYKGMLNSILGYGIRGCIWYQGEANIRDYKNYPKWFDILYKDWIKKWEVGEFPIYFCQIAPYPYIKENVGDMAVRFREIQLKVAQEQKNAEIAILLDSGEENCIHPSDKKTAGERLAYIAMAKTYGFENFSYKSPSFSSMEMKGKGKVWLRFTDAPLGLMKKGDLLPGFELAGKDKIFYSAKARIIREGVELISDSVPDPVAVRYAFKNYIEATLFGVNGMPVSSFRSDDWD